MSSPMTPELAVGLTTLGCVCACYPPTPVPTKTISVLCRHVSRPAASCRS